MPPEITEEVGSILVPQENHEGEPNQELTTEDIGATTRDRIRKYPDLAKRISDLRRVADPLHREAGIMDPLIAIIDDIRLLPGEEDLEKRRPEEVQTIKENVSRYEEALKSIAYESVKRIIAEPKNSVVFEVLANANLFEERMRKSIGKKIAIDGHEQEITPEFVEALTRFNFSIGTPPITPKGIETIEQIMFGGTLKDVAGFSELLAANRFKIQQFIGLTGQMIEQSTRYTTKKDREVYKLEVRKFAGLKGGRALTKAVVNNGMAEDLIRQRLVGKKFPDEKTQPVELIDKREQTLTKADIEEISEIMRERGNRNKLFVVKVSHLPETFFTPPKKEDGRMYKEWEGVIGRLIIVEEPKNAIASSVSTVYSMHPEITEYLQGWHTKSLGTPANTQMNLRLMLEKFSFEDLQEIMFSIDELLGKLKGEINTTPEGEAMTTDYARRREWIISAQKDFSTLKRFREFTGYVAEIKSVAQRPQAGAVGEGIAVRNAELKAEIERLSKDYFGGSLKNNDDYDWICHGSGGGRGGLGIVEKWLREKSEARSSEYLESGFSKAQASFAAVKAADLIPEHSTYISEIAVSRALADRRSPLSALREDAVSDSAIQISIEDRIRHLLTNVEGFTDKIVDILNEITGKDAPGALKAEIKSVLKRGNIDAVAKILEREPYSKYSNRYKEILESIIGGLREGMSRFGTEIQEAKSGLEAQNYSFSEKIIGEMAAGTYRACVIVPDKAWSYDDIYDEDYYSKSEFPKGNYIRIKTKQDGSLDWHGLQKRLEGWEKQCTILDKRCGELEHNGDQFQKMFKVFCENLTLIDNSPRNPTAAVDSTKDRLVMLDIASRFGIKIVADAAYHKIVDTNIKDEEGDYLLADLYERNPTRFKNDVNIYTVLPSTKWAMGGGRRTSMLISNDEESHDGGSFREFVGSNTKGENTMSLYMDRETYKTGVAVKESCKVVEEAILTPFKNLANVLNDLTSSVKGLMSAGSILEKAKKIPATLGAVKSALSEIIGAKGDERFEKVEEILRSLAKVSALKGVKNIQEVIDKLYDAFIRDFEKAIDDLLEKKYGDVEAEGFNSPVYFRLIEIRNTIHLLRIRKATWPQFMAMMNEFVKELKDLRLDKQTQRDTAERVEASQKAIAKVQADLGIELDYMKPDGPFYFLLRIIDTDESPADLALFLPAIARFIKVDPVPMHGYVRYGLGGRLDGSKKGYELYAKAIETDIKILLEYWEKFKKNKGHFENQLEEGVIDPSGMGVTELALSKTFPSGDEAIREVVRLKGGLATEIMGHKENGRGSLVGTGTLPIDVQGHISKITPDAPTSVVTIKNFECQETSDFVGSRSFQDLYNHYLSIAYKRIPELDGVDIGRVLRDYGAEPFADRFADRKFRDNDKEIFAKIITEISKMWFSDANVRILSHKVHPGKRNQAPATLDGFETRMHRFMGDIANAFSLSGDQRALMTSEANFQVAYSPVSKGRLAKPNPNLPDWLNTTIQKSELIEFNSATDPSSTRDTLGSARVAGHDRGIFKRDGNGKKAPSSEHFRNRLQHFAETMDESEYVCKLIQVGPVKNLLIMHRSYSHYLADELRLFPQTDLSFKDIKEIEPDSVSFLGIPEKVMGEDYKVGYFFDEKGDGTRMPVSWVDREGLTDYMGYLKKPILTACNECIQEWGGLSIHGAAFTVTTKDGLRKTFVSAGDSGAGKSETIVAMMEQVIAQMGGAENIEEIGILAGDMLSLFIGDDGQIYMFGTEEGDFMRMTDIPTNWRILKADLLALASRTNVGDVNERATVGNLIEKGATVKLTRVNAFATTNNFEEPPGSAMQKVEDKYHFLLKEFLRGYRKEKGTSGDQPNLHASVLFSDQSDRYAIQNLYGEKLDELLTWEVIVNERGKPKNGILSFRDIPGGITEAKKMVTALFDGKALEYEGEKVSVTETEYKPYESREVQNRFYVKIKNEAGVEKEVLLDRKVFDAIYEPIVSTLGGQPFVHPDNLLDSLTRVAKAISSDDEFLTFMLYTRLAVNGQAYSGPARGGEGVIDTVLVDPHFNQRFQRHKQEVTAALQDKYGDTILGHGELPKWVQKYNLRFAEKTDTEGVKLVWDSTEEVHRHIDIETKGYKYVPGKQKLEEKIRQKVTLISDKMKNQLRGTMQNNGYKSISFEEPEVPIDLSAYQGIRSWDSPEELIYQVLIINGAVNFRNRNANFESIKPSIKEAEYIAQRIMKEAEGNPKK